jgi:PIN domain nuclease of toxin-antitoxin system
MVDLVVDSSAMIAWLQGEPGVDRLGNCFPGALVSSVNLAEVQTKLISWGDRDSNAWARSRYLGCQSVPFDDLQAKTAGSLVRMTKPYGLSLGDRACLALAIQRNATVYTTDRDWSKLSIGIKIEVIR